MGPYNPSTFWVEFTGVLTNCMPTDAYRGAGRPEATYVVERIVDASLDGWQGPGRGPADEPASAVREATTSIMG